MHTFANLRNGRKMLARILLNASILIALLTPIFAQAQTGGVKGFVYSDKDGSSVIYTNVFLKGTTFGIATDGNGFYSISKVPPGEYTLTVKGLGYENV